jgi:hypothetical protein
LRFALTGMLWNTQDVIEALQNIIVKQLVGDPNKQVPKRKKVDENVAEVHRGREFTISDVNECYILNEFQLIRCFSYLSICILFHNRRYPSRDNTSSK